MKALWNDQVIAEADKDDLIYIEQNWYFPPSSVKREYLRESDTPYTCPWKGVCQYFDVGEGDNWSKDSAWSYPNPKPTAIDTVKKDFSNYVAFWRDVKVCVKIIIFDFDGTIADTFKVSIEIAHKLTGRQSLSSPKEVAELKHDSMIQAAEQLKVPKYMWPFLVFKGRRLMSQRLGDIKPFEGMEEVLKTLHKEGYRMFIMSTNSRDNIATFLFSHGLSGCIERVYGSVGLLSKAGALRKIIAQNKISPKDVIYIGDEVRDIEAAKSANVPVVAVSWGFNDVNRLTNETPTALVSHRKDLLTLLESWERSKDLV